MSEINFNQHEREIIIDSCLGELDNKTFDESYFSKLLETQPQYADPEIKEKIVQIGVNQWFTFVTKIDQTRQIPNTRSEEHTSELQSR